MTLTRIGLLGGMSWESTAVYYRTLNETVRNRVGGHASAPLLLWSAEFGAIEALQRAGDWDAQGRILAEAAVGLQQAGAAAVALATNTLHLVADQITAAIDVPFIDLIEVVGTAATGFPTVGLLGTGYTMTSELYPKRLAHYGVEVIVPSAAERELVHRVIYEELLHGVVTDASREAYLGVIDGLVERGAGAVVLGCTEIGMLVGAGDTAVPLLDTTRLHCQALADVIIDGLGPAGPEKERVT